jgi:hypothetical protein
MTSSHQEFHANRRRLEEEMRNQRQNTYRQQRDVELGATAMQRSSEARRVGDASRQNLMRAAEIQRRNADIRKQGFQNYLDMRQNQNKQGFNF